MKTYIYKAINSSVERGYNRTIEVYRIKNNKPEYVGYTAKISTASYKGDYAVACDIINTWDKLKLEQGGYKLASKSVQLFEV